MAKKKDYTRGGFYAHEDAIKTFDDEARKYAETIKASTGADVTITRGDFITVLGSKLKSGEITL